MSALSGAGEKMPVNIDVRSLKDVVCDNCGNATFEHIFLLKHVPALISPRGVEGLYPIPEFGCCSCGKPLNMAPSAEAPASSPLIQAR